MKSKAANFIALSDLLICLLCYVLIAVNPPVQVHAGVEMKAEYLIRASWPVKDYDADIDLWLATPHGRISFSGRQSGCAALDIDNRGWQDSMIPQPDGSSDVSSVAIETISLRCSAPGHYDAAINFFGYSDHDHETKTSPGKRGVPVHFWIEKVNPEDKIIFQSDLTLNSESPRQSINTASFDIGTDGEAHFVDPPLSLVPQR